MITSTNAQRPGGSKRAHKQLPKHTVHSCVAVVGLPSHDFKPDGDGDRERTAEGVGKSCLCSRFVLPSHDDYTATEEHHPSVVSPEEFNDPEINGVHYLYFGTVLKVLGHRSVVFHIVEQTTFTDSAGSPHAGGENYAQRSTAQTLRCPNKISYIGARFKGIAPKAREKFPAKQFDRRSGPDGGIKGYVLVVDPTLSAEVLANQISLLESSAEDLSQARLPFVIALTKCDQCSTEQKGNAVASLDQSAVLCGTAVFETSARTGVGVDEAFFHLHCQMARRRNRRSSGANSAFDHQTAESLLGFPYQDAAGAQWLARERAVSQVTGLLGTALDDSRLTWSAFLEKIGRNEAVAALITFNGMEFCRALFKQHVLRLHLGQQQGDAVTDIQDLVNDHADFVQDDKPLDVDAFLKPLSQERWEVKSSEEDEEEETYANSGEGMSARTAAHADFYFGSAVADVFGQVSPAAEEDLHERLSSVASNSSRNADVPSRNDTLGAEEAGLNAEADDSAVADCYYIIGPAYHGGVQKSKHLLRQLSRQYTARSQDDEYIDIVSDPTFTIEEASDSSDDETDFLERSTESELSASMHPLECFTEEITSKPKSATLRSGLSTLKSAFRGKANKTSTLLSFGRRKSKESKSSTGSGTIDLLVKSVGPVQPSLVITSPEERDGEGGASEVEAAAQPLELLYETGEEQEVYESVVDVSSSLSCSSAETTPSAMKPSASSVDVEYDEDDDVYSSVTPLDSTKTSPHSAKRPNTSLTESQHSQRSLSISQPTSPPASRNLPPVPLPPATFETTGGVVINRPAPCPSPANVVAPPALPARNYTSTSSLPALSPSPGVKPAPPFPPSNETMVAQPKPKVVPPKPRRPPPARPPARPGKPESQQGDISRTSPAEDILYEDAAAEDDLPSTVHRQTSAVSQYEAEEEDLYELMESVPIRAENEHMLSQSASYPNDEDTDNVYVLEYSPPSTSRTDTALDSSDLYDDVLALDSGESRPAGGGAATVEFVQTDYEDVTYEVAATGADKDAGSVLSEKETRWDRTHAKDVSGAKLPPSLPTAVSKPPPPLPKTPPAVRKPKVPGKPPLPPAPKPHRAVSPKLHPAVSSKPPPALPSKPAPPLPAKTPPPLPSASPPSLPTRTQQPSKLSPYLRSPSPASTHQGSPSLPRESLSATMSSRASPQASGGGGSSIHDLLAAAAADASEGDADLYEMPGDAPPIAAEPESKARVSPTVPEKSRPHRPPPPAPALLKSRSMSTTSETTPTEVSSTKRPSHIASLETQSESVDDCEYEVPVELQRSGASADGDIAKLHTAAETMKSADSADKTKKKTLNTKGRFGGLKTAIGKKVPKKR